MATGTVQAWDDAEGWGVLASPETPGGCWAHVSVVVGSGHLEAGQAVSFELEAAEQDGYRFRATVVWPEGGGPDRPRVVHDGPSDAYRSELTIRFD